MYILKGLVFDNKTCICLVWNFKILKITDLLWSDGFF